MRQERENLEMKPSLKKKETYSSFDVDSIPPNPFFFLV